ncbi:hypothetical protein CYMTET_44237 [Cymbomonas tetramitiformis]|uniref:Uncharacterized protein n=1 Tax=Cymbomonas tetramitiformis TaxID=36881 RepID=A0AAE0EZU5_9CHLO|nr:hypothetical protein CYMTET_44237 [Cymbomonas tetramitiformis]
MGRAKARLVATSLLSIARHYKALALASSSALDLQISAFEGPLASLTGPISSDFSSQYDSEPLALSSAAVAENFSQTTFDILRFDVGVQGDVFDSTMVLFSDNYGYMSSEERIPWCIAGVAHLIANPHLAPVPIEEEPVVPGWGEVATHHRAPLTPAPYRAPHKRNGKIFDEKVVVRDIHHHHHHHRYGHSPRGGRGRGRTRRSGGARRAPPHSDWDSGWLSPIISHHSGPSASALHLEAAESCHYGQEHEDSSQLWHLATEVAVDHGSLSPPRGFSQLDEIRSFTSMGPDTRLLEAPSLSFGGGALYMGAHSDPSDDSSVCSSQNDQSDTISEFF